MSEVWPFAKPNPARGRCDRCGRKTWDVYSVGRTCDMKQPDGWPCSGIMQPTGTSDKSSDGNNE